MKKQVLILVGLAIVIIGGGVLLMWKSGSLNSSSNSPANQPLADAGKLQRDNSHMTGKAGAKVTVVEFGDYQCPACAAAYPILKQVLEQQYAGNPDVNFVFRNFPLHQHPNAVPAAEAAEAAGEQGKYWEMHDLLYEHQSDWDVQVNPTGTFVSYAQQLGLDANKFQADIEAKKFAAFIDADQQDGTALQVNATPTLYFNGEKLPGIPSAQELQQKIDAALK
jgi:protein-disulfide isomerase